MLEKLNKIYKYNPLTFVLLTYVVFVVSLVTYLIVH